MPNSKKLGPHVNEGANGEIHTPSAALQSAKSSLGPPLTPGQLRIFQGWSCNSAQRHSMLATTAPILAQMATAQ